MSNKDCGCNNNYKKENSPKDKSYLMVEATASEATTCKPTLEFDGTEECAKQEPMYDSTLSDFLIPSTSNQAQFQVCNPSIYTVGMWIQTINPSISLKITSIAGNVVTVVNRCDDGSVIIDNPDPGYLVAKGTTFIVGSEPVCTSSEDERERVLDALEGATTICLPNLKQSTTTSTVQLVGRMESDPSNQSECKGLQRVIGVLFTNGIPYFSRTRTVAPTTYNAHRSLMINKTTNEVVEMENESTWTGIPGTGDQFIKSVKASNNAMVGPVHLTRYFSNSIIVDDTGNQSNVQNWPTFSSEHNRTYDLSGYSLITGTIRNLGFYFVHVRIEVGALVLNQNSGWPMQVSVYLNDEVVGRVFSMTAEDYFSPVNSISVPVRIDNGNQELKLKLQTPATGNVRYYYRVRIDGIAF